MSTDRPEVSDCGASLRPLILTATMDREAQAMFNEQRASFFPKHRNYLDAHVTLFHKLPAERLGDICLQLQSCRQMPVMSAQVAGLRFLGQGVAYRIVCPQLLSLRAELAATFHTSLTPQDRSAFHPHVTVQNKVAPAEARALFDRLQASFAAFDMQFVGVQVWRYEQGPWSLLADYAFAENRPGRS